MDSDTLDKTEWDVLIVGTGLQQSLLALALSRSGKKILHVDENKYYGGAEAAFSLQEAEEWPAEVNAGLPTAAFSNASISKPEVDITDPAVPSLASSRSYSLELSPQVIYARSALLQYLVSSKVYRQLEFLAVGSWWVYSKEPTDTTDSTTGEAEQSSSSGKLLKVPNGREDVFQDAVLDFKAKRALMKFLRFIADYEEQTEVWGEHRGLSFSTFLSEQFKVPTSLQGPLSALALSPTGSDETTTEYVLPRIARHLRSIGVFGAGFGAVLPRWSGSSEIVQVGCRSCAVGGGVYVLPKSISEIAPHVTIGETAKSGLQLRLNDGESISTQWIVQEGSRETQNGPILCKSISIISSPLSPLFPPIAEDAPSPASAVVVFPSGSLVLDDEDATSSQLPPVHIFVHSNETGECPAGQSILYASTSLTGDEGFKLLKKAVAALLSSSNFTTIPLVLWSMQFQHQSGSASTPATALQGEHIIRIAPLVLDLAFDDALLDRVKEAWRQIVGDDGGEFLVFVDREAEADADEEDVA